MSLLRLRTARLVVTVILVGVAATACGSETDAVSIGDESLSRSDLDAILDGLNPETADTNQALAPTPEGDAGAVGFLSNYIIGEAFALELAERGYPVTDADLAAAADQLAAQNPPFEVDSPAGEAYTRLGAVQLVFEDFLADSVPEVDLGVDPTLLVETGPPEFICSSHILLETEADAEAVVERLDDGDDFAELAKEVSTGPTGPDGGDLGCVATATFIPEFVEGARQVAPSGFTPPVQTQFGWHVISVRSFGPLSVENHPEMDPATVQQELDAAVVSAQAAAEQEVAAAEAAARQEQQGPLVEELRAAAIARIDSDLDLDPRYGEWDDQAGVVAPSGVTAG